MSFSLLWFLFCVRSSFPKVAVSFFETVSLAEPVRNIYYRVLARFSSHTRATKKQLKKWLMYGLCAVRRFFFHVFFYSIDLDLHVGGNRTRDLMI